MNRYKIALGKELATAKLNPDLELRLRKGAAEWMSAQKKFSSEVLSQDEFDDLARKAFKAHRLASRLFSPEDTFSDICIKTASDFMYLDEEKLDKIIDYIKSGK